MGFLMGIGAGRLAATFAIAASILAIGTWYLGTLDALSDTQGAATVQPAPIPDTAIPDELAARIDPITKGYQDHYIGPIDRVGAQVADPTAPDPVAKPLPQLPAGAVS